MIKYAKIFDEETKKVDIALGDDIQTYEKLGFTPQDVEQSDLDGQWYLSGYAPMKTDEQKAQEERERIAMLNLTAADVERAIYKAKGIDFDDIITMVQAQPLSDEGTPVIDIKALKIELKANNFYRGNPYINQVGTLLGFTSRQLDEFFETNDYTKLLNE